ncbi:MAG: hypothetical protein R3B13_39815 [Polyangiaceae bacterium]
MTRRAWLVLAVLTLGAALGGVYFWRVHRERAEVARLYSQSRSCLIGEAPPAEHAAWVRAFGRTQAAQGPTKAPWPGRCVGYLRELGESAEAARRAPLLVTTARQSKVLLDSSESLVEIVKLLDAAAAAAGIALVAVEHTLGPPEPMLVEQSFVSFAGAPKGTKVEVLGDAALVHGKTLQRCQPDATLRTMRCESKWPDPELHLLDLPWKDLRTPPGANLVARGHGEIAVPELVGREPWQMRLVGDSILWIDRKGIVQARRYRDGALGDAEEVAKVGPAVSFVDSCSREAGNVVVLGRSGEPDYSSHDTAIVLFEESGKWKTATASDVRLFHDPDPVYERARVSCDGRGVWLTWASRAPGMHYARCTPTGCQTGTWRLPGLAVPNAFVAELAGKVVLVASRLQPSDAIVMRQGTLEQIPNAPERCLVEGAWPQGLRARHDALLVWARTDRELGALRIDEDGKARAVAFGK